MVGWCGGEVSFVNCVVSIGARCKLFQLHRMDLLCYFIYECILILFAYL